jgi:AraC-like DNA-binding protein
MSTVNGIAWQPAQRPAGFKPIVAKNSIFRHDIGPCAYDCVKLVVIRAGSAILCSELGRRPVAVGEAVLLCSNTLAAAEPEGRCTVSVILIDTDYMIDHLFWKHAGLLSDRLDARELVAKLYLEPVQVFHFGVRRLGEIEPWLDELARLSDRCHYAKRFNRIQALWFLIADVISPFIKVSPVRLSPSQRERLRPTMPRHRRFEPLRSEAMQVAELLRGDLARHWTAMELADAVHLSESQLSRVFSGAYGKTPMTYLTMLRVEELARLLRETDLLVDDAVEQVGWRNVSHAIRVFRAYIGMTPGAYRRTHNVVV